MKFFGNVTKLEADIEATSAALQPVLEKANITTAMRAGKVIPISEATNAEKFTALQAAQPAGTDLEARSQLLASNKTVADRCEKAESDLAIASTNVGSLTRENAALKADLTTAKASIGSLTGENSNQINLRDAAVKENARLAKELADINTMLSERCIATGCIDLMDSDGKAFASDAKAEDKLAAANKIPFNDKFKALSGAVNAAIAKTGVNPLELPAGQPKGEQKKMTATERCRADVAKRNRGVLAN